MSIFSLFSVLFRIGSTLLPPQINALPPQVVPATVVPTTIQNPLLTRAIAPQIRQPMHMSPAKSSLSHVNIQHRQAISPVSQKPTIPQNVQTPTQSKTNVKETTAVGKSMPQITDIDSKHAPSIEIPPKVPSVEVAPTSVISTQMPQIPKQIVFETKLPQMYDIDAKKSIDDRSVEAPKITIQPTIVQSVLEHSKTTEMSKPKVDVEPAEATTSVISSTSSAHSAKIDEPKKTETALVQGKTDTSALKEDNDYWSAKEVNIESVIKKVDALCSATEDEANVETKSGISPQKDEISDVNVAEKDEKTNSPVEETDTKTDSKSDGKNQAKRDKLPRSKKTQPIETPTVLPDTPKAPPVINVVTTESSTSGVQTRRGNNAKPPPPPKRGRNNRNASPRATNVVPTGGLETKPRNTHSESDIYEFHEDSGEETMSVQSNEATRSRALSISKTHHQPSTQPSSPNAPQSESAKASPPPVPQPVVSQPPVIVAPAMEQEIKPLQPSTIQTTVAAEADKSIEQSKVSDLKEDSAAAALNSLRKSRRLIERDESRSTVDDIIEDVVKNLHTSVKEPPTVITTSAAIVQSTTFQSSPAQPRRSTRNITNQTTTKLQTNEKVDIRKSPRPNRNAKDRKTSECESTSDEKGEEQPRSEFKNQEEKGIEHPIENCPEPTAIKETEPIETSRKEIKPEQPIEKPIQLPAPNQSRIVEPKASTGDVEKKSSEPMALIDPVTGELTVVQQSKEGQYVPIVSNSVSNNVSTTIESVVKSSAIVTSTQMRQPAVEVTVSTVPPKISTAPVVTIINKPIPAPIITTVSHHVSKPSVSIASTASTTIPHNTFVITSKPVEHLTHSHSGIPLSMSIEKSLAQSQPAIQIKPNIFPISQPQPQVQTQQQHHQQHQHQQQQMQPIPIPTSLPQGTSSRTHPLKAHVLSNAPTPVILSTNVPTMSNVQPVIKSTAVIHSKETPPPPPTVISQQPQSQYQPKIQVAVSQQSQIVHGKNTLSVNIPTSSPVNLQPTHSPRLSHESQYSIHVPKHSVANIHPSQILSQAPVVIHSNKMHIPTTSNYTKVIQAPTHHLPSPQPQVIFFFFFSIQLK